MKIAYNIKKLTLFLRNKQNNCSGQKYYFYSGENNYISYWRDTAWKKQLCIYINIALVATGGVQSEYFELSKSTMLMWVNDSFQLFFEHTNNNK